MEIEFKSRCWQDASINLCEKFSQRKLVELLWLRNLSKEGMARLQTTQPTGGGAITAVTNCCANCVETSRPHQWGHDLLFLGKPAMRIRWRSSS